MMYGKDVLDYIIKHRPKIESIYKAIDDKKTWSDVVAEAKKNITKK